MSKMHFQRVKMDKAERTPNGFLRVPAYLTRTGVFKYRNKDGSILRELRHPDDVFKADSLATMVSIPLTNEHPKKLVDSGSLKKDVAGWVGDNIEIDTIYLKAIVTIADEKAIDDVESGKQELSCGYTADLIPEKGIYNGEQYDVRQTNIVYNHVSLVKRGRAGANVKLHLDDDQSELITDDELNPPEEGGKMAKIKIGNMDFECSAEMADAFGKHEKEKQTEMDGLKQKMNDMMPKADMDKVVAKADALEVEVKELKLKKDSVEVDAEKFEAAVKARVELIGKATKLVKPETKLDGLTDIEIMKTVVAEKNPSLDLKDKSEAYIQARFDIAVDATVEDLAAQDELKKKTTVKTDSVDDKKTASATVAEARKKMIEDSNNAWKTPSDSKH